MPLPVGVEEEIRKLVAGSKDGKVVAGMTQLLSLCQAHGLMQEITIHPNFVCCHVDNRDGIGLNVMDLHQLLDDISSIGFSHDMTNCICVEISSGDHAFMDFNNRIADVSDGLLPKFGDEYRVKYASLAGSHTNAALRCLLNGTKHPIKDSKLTTDGKLDMARVQQVDNGLAQAATSGLRWKVIDFEVGKIDL